MANLYDQIAIFRLACEQFDGGYPIQALRLASDVYLLVHDGRYNSRSLLGTLGLKTEMRFLSSTSAPSLPGLPLVSLKADRSTALFVPKFGSKSAMKEMNFENWYDEIIFQVGEVTLTRKRLISSIRSQDGGAHVDRTLRDIGYVTAKKFGHPDISYVVRRDGGGVTMIFSGYGPEPIHVHSVDKLPPPNSNAPNIEGLEEKPVEQCHTSMMRQVAYELDQSLTLIDL